MALEDLMKPNLVTFAGLGLVAMALPKLLPDMSPGMRSALKSGISLFLEAEGEAEGDVIETLVSATLKQIQRELAEPAPEQDRKTAVQRHIRHFKRRADKVSARWGRGEQGRRRSYRRHVNSLAHSLTREKGRQNEGNRDILDDALATLTYEEG